MARLGLALGGGGVRGLAHIGVLRVLERASIRPDIICGTSSGAIIGLAYAAGMGVDEMVEVCQTLRWRQLVRLSARRGRVFDTEGFDQFLATIIDACDFDDLDFVCAAVARDLATDERVVLATGDPVRAARASSAVRKVFPPIEINGRWLVDGAGVEPVPVGAARSLGADYVIGVAARVPARSAAQWLPAVIGSNARARPADVTAAPDRLVSPALDAFSSWNFGRADELVRAGETAAARALPAIRADLASRDQP